MNYRGHQIIFHEDGGWIVIFDKVVVFSAPTLEEAKAWIDQLPERSGGA